MNIGGRYIFIEEEYVPPSFVLFLRNETHEFAHCLSPFTDERSLLFVVHFLLLFGERSSQPASQLTSPAVNRDKYKGRTRTDDDDKMKRGGGRAF